MVDQLLLYQGYTMSRDQSAYLQLPLDLSHGELSDSNITMAGGYTSSGQDRKDDHPKQQAKQCLAHCGKCLDSHCIHRSRQLGMLE